jgi:integrase
MEVDMFLSKSSSGIYYLYYNDPSGHRHKVTTKARLKTNALNFLTTFRQEEKKRNMPIIFSTFIKQFLENTKSNYQRGTIELYERTRDLFLQIIGDVPLAAITPYHWDKYKSIRSQTVSAWTVNIELRNLRCILNKAFRWELISRNPFAMQPLCPIPERYPVFFTHDEFKIFYNSIKDQWFKDAMLFAAFTGMRRSEILNLRWTDVDLEKKTIHVQSNPTFRTKAGKKRIVPIHEILIPMLESRDRSVQDELVFSYQNKIISKNSITHKFIDVIRESGIQKKGLHLHSLRHTFASWLVQEGVPLYEVQRLLGHSTIAVTEVYAHLQPVQLHNAVNRLKLS